MESTRKAPVWRRIVSVVAALALVAGLLPTLNGAAWADDETVACPDCGEPLTAHAAVEATCTEDGNIAYYTCDNEDCTGSGCYADYDSLSDYELDFDTGSYPAVDIHGYSYSITSVAASVDGLVAYLVDEDGNEQTISADGDYIVWFDDAWDSMVVFGLMTAYYQIFEVTNTELDENGDETLTVYIDPSRQEDWLAWENAQVFNSLDMGWTTLYCTFEGVADEDGNLGASFSGVDADGNAVEFYGLTEIPITDIGTWEISSFTPDGLVEIFDGAERVAATGHDLSLVEAVEPSCTESGNSAYYECANCGKLFADEEAETETTAAGVYLPATGHSAGESAVENEVAATCTTDGSYQTNSYCTVCGELVSSTTTVVSATGHSWDEGVVTEPTCTEGGYTTYTCTVCGGELEGGVYTDDETAALGHSYDYDEVVWEWSEDCNSATASVACTVCGEVQTVDAEIAIETTDNACFSGGSVTYTATASFEDGTEATDVQSFEVPAGDHTIVAVEAVEAGCETSGNSAYYKCTVCGKLFSDADATTEITLDDVTIAATGHTAGEAVVENEVAATCTTAGSYQTNTYCAVCGELLSSETTTVAASGHSYDYADVTWSWAGDYSSATAIVSCTNEGCTGATSGHSESVEAAVGSATTAATCTEAGAITYTATATLGDGSTATDTQTVTIAATGHTAGEAVVENEVAATCTTAGSYQTNTYCTVCGELLTSVTTTIPATGHSWGEGVVTEPTCTEGGYTTHTCTVCGSSYTDDATAATGHSYDYGNVTWTWADDCSSATASVSCTEGDDSLSYEASVTSRTTDAACTTDGAIVYTATATLGDGSSATDSRTVTIAATGHTAGSAVVENEVAATCTADGSYQTNTYCTVCGQLLSSETTTVAATGHSYDYGKVTWTWADDFSSATASVSCSACGAAEVVDAAVTSETVEATCTQDGSATYTATATLGDGSSATDVQTVAIAATGHSYEAAVTEPGCTEGGCTTWTCTACGDSYTSDETAATGHSYEASWTWAEDCSSAALSLTCSACGDVQGVDAVVTSSTAEDGSTVYTATASYDGVDYSDSQTVAAEEAFEPYFTDVQDEGKYYFDAVYALADAGIINGVSDTLYGVNQNMTRAQFATIVWRIAGEPATSYDAGYTDVKDGQYYTEAINWAAEEGVVTGYTNGRYGINDTLSFEDMCLIIARYANGGDDALQSAVTDTEAAGVLAAFADGDAVAAYADNGMAWCVTEGLVTGNTDGTIVPQESVNRQRGATVVARWLELVD